MSASHRGAMDVTVCSRIQISILSQSRDWTVWSPASRAFFLLRSNFGWSLKFRVLAAVDSPDVTGEFRKKSYISYFNLSTRATAQWRLGKG